MSSLRSELYFYIFILVYLVSACQTNKVEVAKNIGSTRENIDKNSSSYVNMRITRILHDFEASRITEAESDEAFLLGKIFEEKKEFEIAKKLYLINFFSSKNLTGGLSLVNCLVNLKEYDEALDIALKLTVLFPKNPDVELSLANIYFLKNDQKSLVKTLESAYKKFPSNETIVVKYALNINKGSKKILEKFLLKHPKSTSVILSLSELYFNEKNYKKSLNYAKSAYLIDSDNVEIISIIAKIEQQQKNYKEAEKYFKLAFEKELDNNLNAQNYVNILLYQKKIQEALSILLKLESSSDEHVPFPPEFSFQIARILLVNKDYEGAKKRLLTLDSMNYADPHIKYYLALCSQGLRSFQEALKYLSEVPENSSLYQESRKGIILIQINSKNKMDALDSIKKFEISKNNLVEDSIFKANILAYFSKYDEALGILNYAINKKPNARELYLKKAEYIKYTESKDAAITLAEKIASKWPNYADGLNFLGYSLIEKNEKLDYAKKVLLKAISIDPQNGFYLDSLGWLYYQKNDISNSLRYLNEALKYEPEEPVIMYHLAMAQFKDEMYNESLNNFYEANRLLENLLPYQIESDQEIKKISKSINVKILEVKKIIEKQKYQTNS